MNIKIKILQKVTPSEKLKLQKFSDLHWGEHSSDGDIRLDFFAWPEFAVVARVKNKILGLLFVFKKEVEFKDHLVKVAGLGGVVTHKEFRRKGIASKLLSKAMEVIKKKNYDEAMLCTDINKLGSLYDKFGFVPLGKPYFFTNKNGQEKEEKGGMIAPVNAPKIFNEMLQSNSKINVGISNF